MASGYKSGETSGNQLSFEQNKAEIQAAENEAEFEWIYISDILPKTAPIDIPPDAKIDVQRKDGYDQVKYEWRDEHYKYECRWHTRTPNAPPEQGDSWVIQRDLPGLGYGKNAHPSKREILIGIGEWVPLEKWKAAIHARKAGASTKEQKEMLDHGHWKPKR